MPGMIPTSFGGRPAVGIGSWQVRRAYLFTVSAFCMGVIAYTLGHDMHSRVAETAVNMAFIGLISMVGSYVFSATWQDISTIRAESPRGNGGGYGGGYGDEGMDFHGGGWNAPRGRRRGASARQPRAGVVKTAEKVDEL